MDDQQSRGVLEHLSTRFLAQRVGLAERAFRREFKAVTGTSPQRYIVQRRMDQAAAMLAETSDTVKNIARCVGYNDPYHFSHVFKATMGVSPLGYRGATRKDRNGGSEKRER